MSHKTERGVFELKQGRVLCITDASRTPRALVAAVDGLDSATLERIRSVSEPVRLVVTTHRGRALGIDANGASADLGLTLGPDDTPHTVLGLAGDPVAGDADAQLTLGTRPATTAESAGLMLTRLGRLLPAVVAVEVRDPSLVSRWLEDGTVLDVSTEEVELTFARAETDVTRVAEASFPLAGAEQSRFVYFREGGGFLEHVAVLVDAPEGWPDPVPVRLHSACLTGDLFSSMRCDCGEQLRGSIQHFKERGGGVLVYLAQEGRGIGLGNKVRAYTIQDAGLDTIDADGVLGFGADERRYDTAVEILRQLGIDRVELLTNNPEKVAAVEGAGIEVVARTPIYGAVNRHNLRYVQAKADRSGHWLMDMIAQRVAAD